MIPGVLRRARSIGRRARLGAVLAAALTLGLHWAGFFQPLEQAFGEIRFRLLTRPASGDLVLVQIDSRSLRELPVWPWPRTVHAEVLERLLAAGASTVALDIDFSARSTPAADAALERALRLAPNRVVLPVFQQHRTVGVPGDGVAVTGPLPRFADHATLAGVNMRPDRDGLVRHHAAVQDFPGGDPIPSMAARLAEGVESPNVFAIDYGVRVETLPRLSYADVHRGAFDPSAVAGRTVIVGAAAFELGDVLAVPIHRALPGAVVHALAYEAMVQGRTLRRLSPIVILGGTVGLALVFGSVFRRLRWRSGLCVAAAATAALLALAVAVQALAPVTPEILPWVATVVLSFVIGLLLRVDELLRRLFRQGMALLHRTALLRRVVEDSFDAIVITDPERRIEMINPAGLTLLGAAEADLVGRHLDQALPQLVMPEAPPRADGEEPVQRFDVAVGRPAGPVRRLEVAVRWSILRRGDHPLERRRRAREVLIFVLRDVTVQREAERARDDALREAQAASKAKSDFLANMSHELRTPLNAIIGFSEIVKDELLGPVGTPAYADYARDIHASGQHLLHIITDILDLSQVEAGSVATAEREVDVGGVVRFAVRMVGARADSGRVAVRTDLDPDAPRLWGDERLVRQIVVNLVSNAVKFTPPGGSVEVALGLAADGALALSVADTGIGIAASDLPEVVKPFRQASGGRGRKYEGTGLGLALVKSFVELHQGTFALRSVVGCGTTATVRFPGERLRRPRGAGAPADPVPAHALPDGGRR